MKGTNQDGFTIIETLVALIVLAIVSVMFARSVSSASAQLSSADKLIDAASLGKKLMAETEGRSSDGLEGIDSESGLVWRRRTETIRSSSSDAGVALVLISIEVFRTKASPAIFRLHTVKSGARQK